MAFKTSEKILLETIFSPSVRETLELGWPYTKDDPLKPNMREEIEIGWALKPLKNILEMISS